MRLIAIVSLLLLSPASFALSLSPAPADQSIQYLGEIFGQVGSVLSGNANGMVGHIFYTFNYAVIILACILITYILFTSILNTANDGEAMGKRGTMWVPLRMVLGIALLLPKAGGYSAMQALVMWIVLQGVGAADSIWSYTVETIAKGAGTVNPPSMMTEGSLESQQNIYKSANALLGAQVCVDAVNQIYSTATNTASFSCQVQPIAGTTGGEVQIVCGGTVTNATGGTGFSDPTACGSITPDYAAIDANYPAVTGTSTISNTEIYDAVAQALPQMLAAIQPAAQAMAQDVGQKIADPSAMPTQMIPGNAITNAVNVYQATVGNAVQDYYRQVAPIAVQAKLPTILDNLHNKGEYPNACPDATPANIKKQLQDWTTTWKNTAPTGPNNVPYSLSQYIATQAEAYEAGNHCSIRNPLVKSNQIEAQGWFTAGSYYLVLAEESYLKSNAAAISGNGLPGFAPSTYINENSSYLQSNWSYYAKAVEAYANSDTMRFFLPPGAPVWMVKAAAQGANTNNPNVAVVQSIDMGMSQWITLFNQLSGYSSKTNQFADPLIAMQKFGGLLISDAIYGFKETGEWFNTETSEAWMKSILPVGGKIWSNNNINSMIGSLWYLPLGMAVLGMMLSAGMMLSIYMPLIPFILFTLGSLGWLIGVIEAMVAAPIVCFGIMHPHGQSEVMGKGEPAVMLMINMFMRPSLMIVGMMLGIGLIYVSLSVINTGFATVVSSIVTFGGSVSGPYMAASLMAIYGIFVSMVVQKCFSMITVVPDNVLRWIQGGDTARSQFGEMGQIGEQMSQKVGQGASQISSAAGQGASQKGSNQVQIAGNDKSTVEGIGK